MTKSWTPIKGLEPGTVSLADEPRERLEDMLAAGLQIRECHRVLKKGGANIVGELLKTADSFYEYDHYPDGDVYDEDSHGQYFYHAHRGLPGENGHFHTFMREQGIPQGISPVPYDGDTPWPKGDDLICHFIAISMDGYGFPIGLFATNRWVTDENWYKASDVEAILDGFVIDHAVPSWPTNIWVGAMLRLFRPEISALVEHRDTVVESWAQSHPGEDVFEDRDLEMTGYLRISVEKQIEAVQAALS